MNLFHRTLALILSLSLFIIPMGQAQAALIANTQLLQHSQQIDDKEVMLQAINRAGVQEQLSILGVNTTDIENRIKQMTGEEIAQLNQQLDELPAGGDALGLIVLVFLVFVVTDVIGATDIFPFIHPVK